MKLRNSVLILIICLLGCFLTGCRRNRLTFYSVDSADDFIDEIYYYIDKEKDYVLVDLRTLDEYATGHFFGFINYDIKKGNIEEFIYKIESMHSKNKAIFLIGNEEENIIEAGTELRENGYGVVNCYLGSYKELERVNNGDFEIKTGTDDCGC